jgi:hypothetical protein
MALNTKVASSTAETYITLVEANAYIASRPDSLNWGNHDYLERERLLRQATIDIDIFKFKGVKLFKGGGGGYEATPASTGILDLLNNGYQNLKFPRDWHEYYTGYPNSGTTLTLVDSSFTNLPRDDDYFNYGAIYIIDGTNKGSSRTISDYDSSTGTFTVDTAFPSAINRTSHYIILAPIDKYVKYATVEQALFLSNNSELRNIKEWQQAGITARTIGDVSIKFGESRTSMDRVFGSFGANAYKYIQRFIDTAVYLGRA